MNNQYWQPELETMPRKELEALQVKKLRQSIEVSLRSPFYKKRLGDLGITPDSIQTIEDIRKIPFTTKQDLRDNYPFGLVGGDMKDAIRIHSTSGTTGHPTVVTYSRHDIDSWANMIARDMYIVWCGEAGCHHGTGSCRQLQAPDHVYQGLRNDVPACHPVLCHPSR